MKKLFSILAALTIISAAFSGCSSGTTDSSATDSNINSTSSGKLEETSEFTDDMIYFRFKAGEHDVQVIVPDKKESDGGVYTTRCVIKTDKNTADLASPMANNSGIFISSSQKESFQTEKLTVDTSEYDLVIFKSDKSQSDSFATCYVINKDGEISRLDNEYPKISGDITVDGDTIIFSEDVKYTVDIDANKLVKA